MGVLVKGGAGGGYGFERGDGGGSGHERGGSGRKRVILSL